MMNARPHPCSKLTHQYILRAIQNPRQLTGQGQNSQSEFVSALLAERMSNEHSKTCIQLRNIQLHVEYLHIKEKC